VSIISRIINLESCDSLRVSDETGEKKTLSSRASVKRCRKVEIVKGVRYSMEEGKILQLQLILRGSARRKIFEGSKESGFYQQKSSLTFLFRGKKRSAIGGGGDSKRKGNSPREMNENRKRNEVAEGGEKKLPRLWRRVQKERVRWRWGIPLSVRREGSDMATEEEN